MGLKMSAGIDLYHHIVDETDDQHLRHDLDRWSAALRPAGHPRRLGAAVRRRRPDGHRRCQRRRTLGRCFSRRRARFNKAWVGYNLTYNGLDDQKHPTEGLYATLTQQYVGWDYNFLKTEAKARYFMPIYCR